MILAWQKTQWEQCVFLDKHHRMPQALLLSGIKGLGKRHFAHTLGAFILCQSPDKVIKQLPCGHCQSCQWMEAKHHPEWFSIVPLDKSLTISIDQIRELTTLMQLTPHYAKKKWILIEESDRLTPAASHALLKILEEPTASTSFILVTAFKNRLLPTIKSRLIEVSFSPPLENEIPAEYYRLPIWALRMAKGAPLAATELTSPDFMESRDQFIEGLDRLLGDAHPIQIAEFWMKKNQNHALYLFYYWLIDLVYILMNKSPDTGSVVNIDQIVSLQALAKRCSIEAVFSLLEKLEHLLKVKHQVSACNDQLSFELLLIDYVQLMGRDIKK